MIRYYAGIGSRETPPDVMKRMTQLARRLDQLGFVLRTGGADGADTAFARGVEGSLKQVFLPWKGFNGVDSAYCTPAPEAYAIAGELHPAWTHLTTGAKRLHARNVHQILGANLQEPVPSEFIVCWTRDGCDDGLKTTAKTGGTGGALRVAAHLGVNRIFNLKNEGALDTLTAYIRETTPGARK